MNKTQKDIEIEIRDFKFSQEVTLKKQIETLAEYCERQKARYNDEYFEQLQAIYKEKTRLYDIARDSRIMWLRMQGQNYTDAQFAEAEVQFERDRCEMCKYNQLAVIEQKRIRIAYEDKLDKMRRERLHEENELRIQTQRNINEFLTQKTQEIENLRNKED